MERTPLDLDAYVERTRSGHCFICEFVGGNPDYEHHRVHEDDEAIVFLSKYPTLVGYCLIAPKQHLEDLADDLSERRYLRLQALVHRLARALKRVLPVERVYVLSLGSKQGNSHLHWHVVPLPPGVPYEKQQYHALMAEHGILNLPEPEMRDLALSIGNALRAGDP
jgi:diadenosine tetraphosphate (Ap4A) HIT family hydrolase